MHCNFNVIGTLWNPFMIKFGPARSNNIHSSGIEHQTNLIPLYYIILYVTLNKPHGMQ